MKKFELDILMLFRFFFFLIIYKSPAKVQYDDFFRIVLDSTHSDWTSCPLSTF